MSTGTQSIRPSTGRSPVAARVRTPLAVLLLVSTATILPGAAFAQDSGADVTPQGANPATEAAAEEQARDAEGFEDAGAQPATTGPDISIPGGGIIVTGRRTRDVVRSSSQVISVLSSEEIARTGEGNIAGALSRVTGLSLVGNGLVYVRGLGDRYSLALLNGLPLPSPQPLQRVVPLDIFPTNVIASSLVQKSYSPNFPGEFGGGVVNLTTVAVPEESFVRISAGGSLDTETTGRFGYSYFGSDTDWTGFDNGSRDLPPALQDFFDSGARIDDIGLDQQAIAGQIVRPRNAILQRVGDLPPGFSGTITAGTSFDVGSDTRLGVIATASISNKWRNRDIVQQRPLLADLSEYDDFRRVVTDNRIIVNGLLTAGLEFGENSLRWTNLFIRDTLKQGSLALGNEAVSGFTKQVQNTAWFERQLIDTQLVGEFSIGELSVDLRGGYANTQREAPYELEFEYVRTNLPNDPYGGHFINVLDRQRGSATATFSNLEEDLWFGGLDVSFPISLNLKASAGYAYTDTSRYSERRQFLYNASTSFEDAVGLFSPVFLLAPAIVDYYDIGLIEATQSDPAFEAGLRIHAAYGQLRFEPFEALSIDIGARYEDAVQDVNPVELFSVPTSSGASTLLKNDYVLPAATITYELQPGMQLRASASKTIARPQFRELIFQTYYDPESNRQFNGNPLLADSELINAEARFEWYFAPEQRVSVAGFYKDIDRPIEAYSSFSDNEQITSFANAPSAVLYGGEFELTKYLGLYGLGSGGGFFASRRAVVIANYTYTQSELKVGPDDIASIFAQVQQPASNFFDDGAPLTGQSDHLVNLQIGLEDTENLSQQTLLLSYASKRVTSRGAGPLPDIFEDPGFQLDFVARQGADFMGQPVEFKFEARNLLGQDNEEYQQLGDNRVEINSYDVGRTFSLSVATEF